MMQAVYITDVIGEVVTAVKNQVLNTIQANETEALGRETLIETINYQKGHKRELLETLLQMDKSETNRYKKYPMVYLAQDFREEFNPTPGIYADTRLSIIICHQTKADYKVGERYDKVFKTVLYPIFNALINQLFKHPQIHAQSPDTIKGVKWDRLYWGRQAVGGVDATKLNDFVDAIEIENLQLKFKNLSCF